MTAIQERTTFDAAAFTRWCADELYTPAIREGTQVLELACDIRHDRSRRECRSQNLPPLVFAPSPPTFRSRQQGHLAHAVLLGCAHKDTLRAQHHDQAIARQGGLRRRETLDNAMLKDIASKKW